MTAENTESTDASGGDDLRARYLPVSRKELRRRREAELAAERAATGSNEDSADLQTPSGADAEDLDDAEQPLPSAVSAETPGGALESEDREDSSEDPAAQDAPEAEPEPEPEPWGFTSPIPRASATAGSPTPDHQNLPEERPEDSENHDGDHGAADLDEVDPAGVADNEDIPEADDTVDTGAEDTVDTGAEDTVDTDDEDLADDESAVAEEAQLDEEEVSGAEDAGLPEDRAETDEEETDGHSLSLPEPPRTDASSARPQDLPGTEIEDEDEAPVPASRKSRRSLRLTGSMSVLSQEKLAELNEIHQTVIANDDPNRVDPELLKKQQALAARAMQANQERRRAEQVEAERDERMRRRRLLPESEVITRKALRAHMESDEAEEHTDYATGSIEPIQARGAHGLEIDAMVEHSTRQGARQSMMGWLVIILAVLLVIAVGVVLSFIL